LLYSLGRKGGDALVRKRFHSATVDKAMAAFRRYGIMAVLIPSILPPPAPFKIFVLLAGVAGIGAWRFATAIVIGRGARYLTEGLLAVWYGERALAFIAKLPSLIRSTLLPLIPRSTRVDTRQMLRIAFQFRAVWIHPPLKSSRAEGVRFDHCFTSE
jgi:uncharacterized membrane protein YdjX (TVP38/TMEM64 family)